ncbi:GFA family protein [Tropicimonas sediminicola]|uniref:Uncharacterized conserved protein n=1 Tax=Tropicimonas sediminicola TaxID=1031541 RepID=A0A239D9P0_9RHOB|nr:GFA family protein [Tropicimonas sediminicola]SNS29019.1 Uncharacterized conserved protein [Tropicimonas sediminicola]
MPEMTLPMQGRCRCGYLTIEITAPPLMTAACHCKGCQRMSGSAYSLTAMIPAQGFRVVAGEPVRGGIRGPQLDHYCCPECMSWVFTRITGGDAFVNVRPTMFDDANWAEPFIETMTSERLPWATTTARHSYKAFPPEAEFADLMAAFAASR